MKAGEMQRGSMNSPTSCWESLVQVCVVSGYNYLVEEAGISAWLAAVDVMLVDRSK
jgi:hypothetical protein